MSVNLYEIGQKTPANSKPVRDNFSVIETTLNDLQSQIDGLTTPPAGSEVTDARDYHTVLRDRLRSASKIITSAVITGGEVTESAVPDMYVNIAAGEAIVGGVAAKWVDTIIGPISAPANYRYDVVAVGSDNSISLIAGTNSADPELPDVTMTTRRPLAIIKLQSGMTSIVTANIIDARSQGAYYYKNGNEKCEWKICDAIDDAVTGNIFVRSGIYYETVILTGKSNMTIEFENGSKVYRPNASSHAICSLNTAGNEESFIKIIGGAFYGNGKAGAYELLKFQYTDNIEIVSCYFDGNASSTATYKNFLIDNCDRIHLERNESIVSGIIDYTSTNISNFTELCEDGRFTGEVMMCGTTAQKSVMLKRGWSELTAMDDKVLRIDKDAAGATGGSDSETLQLDVGTVGHLTDWTTVGYVYDLDSNNNLLVGSSGGAAAGTNRTSKISNVSKLPAYYTLIALIHR